MLLRLAPLALGAAVVVFACSEPATAPSSANGLSLSVATTRSDLQGGQLDTITTTLRNAADTAVTLHFSSGCQLLPYVADHNGIIVLPDRGSWICAMQGRTGTTGAGPQGPSTSPESGW